MVRKHKNRGKKQAAIKDEDWREICKDCDIINKGNNCFYGCEIIKAALNREKKKRI